MDELRRKTQLSYQDTLRLEAEGYLDPVHVKGKGFMVAGEQAKRVTSMLRDARKTGGQFPPAIPALAEDARASFVRSDGASNIAADLLEPYRYGSLQRVWSRITKLATPALRLRAAPPGTPTRSRVGGLPDLPHGVPWPRRGELPLSFVAQVDLSDVARVWPASPLPASGLLGFFYDSVQQPWGYDPAHRGGWSIYHFDHPALSPAKPPDDLPAEAQFRALPTRPMSEVTLPASDSKVVEDLALRDREGTAYIALLGDLEDAQQDDNRAVHRFLGHPDQIQGNMESECQLVANGVYAGNPEARNSEHGRRVLAQPVAWRLVLQIDSDERTGMAWGDDGRIYYWMRQSDIEARRWSEAWLCLQCS
jgi:uncharacterized protein YwqG